MMANVSCSREFVTQEEGGVVVVDAVVEDGDFLGVSDEEDPVSLVACDLESKDSCLSTRQRIGIDARPGKRSNIDKERHFSSFVLSFKIPSDPSR
jgi:hypothetical protein